MVRSTFHLQEVSRRRRRVVPLDPAPVDIQHRRATELSVEKSYEIEARDRRTASAVERPGSKARVAMDLCGASVRWLPVLEG